MTAARKIFRQIDEDGKIVATPSSPLQVCYGLKAASSLDSNDPAEFRPLGDRTSL